MNRRRVLFLAPAIFLLLLGMWAGLMRAAWALPAISAELPAAHGPLMVSGFLGALIGLERAVALRLRWGYLSPGLTLLGSLLLLTAVPDFLALLLIFSGSLLMAALGAIMVSRHQAMHTVVMAGGAAAWAIGNALWLSGMPVYQVVPWWIGFLVLTIAGERLELNRVLRLTTFSRWLFLGTVSVFFAGMLLSAVLFDVGMRMLGAGMLLLALWLFRYDIARRTVRMTGLPRYIAACLLSGYVWLAVSGLLAIVYGGTPAGPYHDAILHAVFLGFVFSMIFGHAPIIFPAVLERPIRYTPVSYSYWVLLQLSLILRVASDLWWWPTGRLWSSMLNAVAILLFLGVTVWSLRSVPDDSSAAARRADGIQAGASRR